MNEEGDVHTVLQGNECRCFFVLKKENSNHSQEKGSNERWIHTRIEHHVYIKTI